MLVIYDNEGTIYYMGTHIKIPVGIPYMLIDVPKGKYITKINTFTTPHEPVFAEYPKSQQDIMLESLDQLRADIDYLLLMSE